ncbi:MAG: FAD-dependent oxidoreductase, partial [Verrucomicrobiae bacterium]|nr:FAD-dependent oxidoreductase [Verrucomicrobiae bacterium]
MSTTRREFFRRSVFAAGWGLGRPMIEAASEAPPIARRGPAKRILILGAGAAGLVAAHELKAAGHEILLIEATARAGGRVHTLRAPFSDGLTAEAGAGRFPPHHSLTFHYIRKFGLRTVPFYPATGLDTYLIGGRRLQAPRGQDPNMSDVPLRLSDEERRLGFSGLYAKYLGEPSRAFGPDWDGTHPAEAASLGGLGFYDYVRQRGGSHDAARYLSLGFEKDSALDMIRDAAGHDVPMLYKIEGGNDQLLQAFARDLREQILYGAPAVRIASSRQGVEVTVEGRAGRQMIHGDRLICTLPFSVLRRIEVAAPLSEAKREAIRRSTYGHVTRLFLQMRRQYWAAEGANGFANFDQPLEMWHPTHDQPVGRAILVGYTYERLARQYVALSPEARVARFLNLTEKVHPGARSHCEAGFSWSWH